MKWLWTWGGKCFGYRDGDNLWTHEGKHVGKFYDKEVYGKNGNYLGEIRNDRLITDQNRRHFRKSSFTPYGDRVAYVKLVDYTGNVMYVGYTDFPSVESFN
ncbi:hypothetical protein [Sporosarcina sp. UB5]|uniref:hypothetical protein n=1 Tax=Sporosarcina sp. UB5 TaxID=3047463 RepID=UPI003D78E61F